MKGGRIIICWIFLLFFLGFTDATSSYISPTLANNSLFYSGKIPLSISTDLTGNLSLFMNYNSISGSLVSYWPMDYYNTTGVYDNSSYGNFGKFTGTGFSSSNIVQSVRGNGLSFDGVDDYINVLDANILDPEEGNFTICGWFNPNNIQANKRIASKRGNNHVNTTATSWYEIYHNAGSLYFSTTDNYMLHGQTLASVALSSNNTWYHFCGVWNWDQRNATLYLNGGSSQNSYVETRINTPINNTAALTIGTYASANYNGSVDEMMLFNRALSKTEISKIYDYTSNSSFFYSISSGGSYGSNNTISFWISNGTNFDILENKTYTDGGTGEINFLFPQNYALQQRNVSSSGRFNFHGNYTSTFSELEYSFDGVTFSNLTSISGGSFNKTVVLNVGRYNLTVRHPVYTIINASVLNVGVGDIFLIIGQSNTLGTGWNVTPINTTLPYLVSIVLRNDNTAPTDPVPRELASTELWSHAFYEYTRTSNIPVFVINAGRGSANISSWQSNATIYWPSNWNGYNLYNYSLRLLQNYTGDYFARSILIMQGEGDSQTSYSDYVFYFNTTINDYFGNLTFYNTSENNFLIGQINHYPSVDHIKRVQQELWTNLSRVGIGAITHDIYTGENTHYLATTEYARYTYSRRWMYALLSDLLGTYDKGGPVPTHLYKINDTTMDIVYDRYIYSDNYIGNDTDATPKGIRVYNSSVTLNDSNILNINITNKRIHKMTITFDQNFLSNTTGLNFTMCASLSCYNEPTIRGLNTVPTEIIFNESFAFETPSSQYLVDRIAEGVCASGNNLTYCIANSECSSAGGYWYSSTCNSAAQSASASTSVTNNNPFTGTFKPSQSSLESGYSVNLGENQKVEITVNNEKETLTVDSISEDKVVISVSGESYDIAEGGTVKIDSNGDGYYDIEVENIGISGNYVNLKFTLISEEIPKSEEEGKGGLVGGIIDEIPNVKEKWYVYAIIGVVVLGLVSYLVWSKYRKKNRYKKYGY